MTKKTNKPLTGTIFRIKKYALHDGPGIRTTVFFKGCPLNCWWCHNPEGLKSEPESMAPIAGRPGSSQTIGKAVTVTEVLSEIEKDILFYDESCGGVTFSGGEPLLQATFLSALLDACREMNIHTTLDTTGYAPMDILHKVVVKSDLVFYDLKIMQDERHIKYTGVSNEPVLRNLTHIANNGTPIHIRIPLIPAITDDADNIQKMCEFLQPLATVRRVDLLPYHRIAESKYRRLGRPYRMKRVPPLADEQVEHIKRKFEANGFCVTTGG